MIKILLLITTLITVVYLGFSKVAKRQIDYISAGKKTNLYSLIATLVMTEVNPMALIAMTSMGYLVGYRALLMALIAFISPLFAAMTTAKKWKNFDGSCVSLIFDKYLGFKIGNMVRIILLSSLTILSATYLKGVIIYYEILFPSMPSSLAIIAVLSFCVFSVVNKGLYGIIRMDIVGIILTIFIALVLLYYSFHVEQIAVKKSVHFDSESILSIKYLLGLLVLQVIMYSIAPWWGQKLFSAINTSTAYYASIISSIFLFFLYSSFILCSIQLRKSGIIVIDSESSFPVMILTFVPEELRNFFTVTFFYIATTTICGVWSPMVGMITSGFFRFNDFDSAKSNYLIWILLGIITYYLSRYKIENVLQSAVLAVLQICSIYFSVIAIFYFKKISKIGCILSIFTSISIGYFSYFYYGEQGNYIWHWVMIGLPAMFTIGYSFSLKTTVKTNSTSLTWL